MNRVQVMMIMLSMVTLLSTTTWAGPGFGPRSVDRLTEALQLDESLSARVEQIFQEQHEKRIAVRDQVQPQLEAIDDETLERLQSVLSEEQLERFTELRNARRDRRHGFGHGLQRDSQR